MKNKLLIVVDMQNDFITGSLGTPEAQAIVPNVKQKIEKANEEETLVLFTKDTHYDNYMETLEGKMLPVPHCIENTEGWCIVKELSSLVSEQTECLLYSSHGIKNNRIIKNTFGSEVLMDFIKKYADEISEIEFCGVCTDICVSSNALMARMIVPDMPITVDASCCAGVTPEKHKTALEVMKSCQINVIGE